MSIVLTGVSHTYRRGQPVLRDVRCTVGDGELVALTGPSGSGKSTLLQLIGRLLPLRTGTIDGRPPLADIRWVFQVPTALGRRSALDNVRLGLLGHKPSEATDMALAALAAVGLSDLSGQRASTLSGGELQRIQVARSLAARPPLVLADEPSAQLDRSSTQAVIDAILATRSPATTIVLATHDPVVAAACDRRLHIADGLVVEVD